MSTRVETWPRRVVLRRGRVSLRVGVRPLAVLAALTVIAAAALVVSVAYGEYAIPPAEVVRSLTGNGTAATDFVVLDLRLPRALTALLAGTALGAAGAVFQAVTRNPLASPDVVGIAGGAALAAAAVIVLLQPSGALAVPAAGLLGALIAGGALYALSHRHGLHGARVVLVGIGLNALAQAGVSYVLTRGRIFEVADAYVWMVGTVNARGWEHVLPLAAALTVLVPAVLVLARRLDALALGDDIACALGVRVDRVRPALLVLAVALTGVAVAATGPIGFVAFLAPHVARRLTGAPSAQALVPVAAGCGAVLVLLADLAGRVAFAPTEVPVGLLTSVLAAPFFLVLLRRSPRIGAAA